MAYYELKSIKESASILHREEFLVEDGFGEPYHDNKEYIQIQKVREAQEDKWGFANGVFATR